MRDVTTLSNYVASNMGFYVTTNDHPLWPKWHVRSHGIEGFKTHQIIATCDNKESAVYAMNAMAAYNMAKVEIDAQQSDIEGDPLPDDQGNASAV